MIRWTVASGLILALGCGGLVEQAANVGSPQRYDQRGVSFDYPGNWTLTDEAEGDLRMLTLESPGDAILLIHDIQPPSPLGLDAFASLYRDGITTELHAAFGDAFTVEDGGSEPVTRTVLGAPQVGQRERYTLVFLGERVPHTLDVFRLDAGARTLVISAQVADEDRAMVEPGFEQVLGTLTVEP